MFSGQSDEDKEQAKSTLKFHVVCLLLAVATFRLGQSPYPSINILLLLLLLLLLL